jgi:recombinational DNA repair protein RecR
MEKEVEEELYECQECGDMTPDKGICFMCKETIIK